MFTLPSIWNIIISTIVFVAAAWYLRRLAEENAIPKGAARGIGVFVLAYFISWGSGELVDYARLKMYGPEPKSELQQTLDQVVKDSGLVLPE
jgi:hypothetical protein